MFDPLARRGGQALDALRLQLANPDKLLALSCMGLCAGVLAGGVIVGFRWGVEHTQEIFLPGEGPENFEGLPPSVRLLLPILGGVLMAGMFRYFGKGSTMLGIARVMERMAYHQGHFSLREFFLQFFGSAIAIMSGHSVGREGPHVFLGSASASLFGQQLRLPNNSIRTLVACGTAAGIGASFNTPLAGVIFALEVVMMEYTVASFIPVILASVSATAISHLVFGEGTAFEVPETHLANLDLMGWVVVLGLFAGAVSASLNHALGWVAARIKVVPIYWRMMLAGVGLGVIGVWLPEVMGIGYDTVQLALAGDLAVSFLALLLVMKIVASAISLGLGVPGGAVGPAVFVGAMCGALLASAVNLMAPATEVPVGTFALLGMGAAISASLQAPLAGLTAMFELTDSPDVILPGMLAVVLSGITVRELFRKESLFVTQLRSAGLDYSAAPVLQALRRRGVASVMNRQFARTDHELTRQQCMALLREAPDWLLIDQAADPRVLMPAADLARFLEANPPAQTTEDESERSAASDALINLMQIPAERRQSAPVLLQATLHEALERLRQADIEALYVEAVTAPGIRRVYGVLTRTMVERIYLD
ncbi:MAG: chloride channel protein [Pseudomonadota bacterium]